MTQVAAKELATDGIRVDVVHPGCIDTPMHPASDASSHITGSDFAVGGRILL